MKALVSAIWLAAFLFFGFGFHLALQSRKMTETLAARAAGPDSDSGQRPVVKTEKSGSVPPIVGARTAVAPTATPWKFTPETPAQRKERTTVSPANSPQARALEGGIRVRLRYHSFYRANGLTQAEIGRFENAVAGKMDPFSNISGLTPEQDASMREDLARKMDQIVGETIGETAVPKMREFIATADLREVADKLAANTFHTDTPLTADQAEAFVRTCMDCRTELGNGIRNLPDAVDWDRVIQQAQSFLTPAQLSVLRTMSDMRRFDQEFKRSTGLPYRSPVRNF